MARAVIFVVLVCISLIAVVGTNRWNARRIKLLETQTTTSNMALALAQHATNAIKSADMLLVDMVERVEVDGTDAAALGRLNKSLMTRVAELPLLGNLIVYDETGRRYAQAKKTLQDDVNITDREYFIYHRDLPDRGPHIGPPVRIQATGDWIITVTRRINHADGRFGGVALASIRMEHFRQYYDNFDIGRSGAIFLALNDGTLLARRPFIEKIIGTDLGDGPVFREYRGNGPVGTAMLTARVDGVERMYSYRHLDHYPLVVGMALAKKEILANWWSDTYRILIGITLLVAALGLRGSRLIRQISIREQLESELREAKSAVEILNRSLETLALHDDLTGLANRRHFEAALSTEFSRARRNGTSLALVMLDVDYFKQYNDIYGHPAGDECLHTISQAVKAAQNRGGDLTARYGGEELAVLLPGVDVAGAIAVAEKILLAVRNLRITHSANPAGIVTISAGVAACVPTREGSVPLELVQAADQALYAAKSGGRDRVCCHDKRTDAL